MSTAFRTLIIPEAAAPLARSIAATLSPAGAGMWTTELASSAEGPATHFISTGQISPEFADMVPCVVWERDEAGAWVEAERIPGSPTLVHQASVAGGLEVTLAEVEALFQAADVSEQEPFVAMARLGLVLVQPADVLEPVE